ncbi:MAG: DUF2934 domain-containing protein [Terriglobales bacterium]|jgi:hypothetical protein
MSNTNAHKQSKPNVAATPKNTPAKLAVMPNTVPTQDRVNKRAYELYENRGCEQGQDKHDWFQAELELSKARS